MTSDTDLIAICGCRGAQAAANGGAGAAAPTGAASASSGAAAPHAAAPAARAALAPGLAATRTLTVDRERTIDFMGEKARVYATPMLVRDIEIACRDLLLAHVEAGQDSVGTRIELDHLAATLLGMEVTLEVRIAAVEGRSVTFEVQGRDAVDRICRAAHVRFVVDRAVTEKRLAAKAAKAGLA